MKMEKTVNDNCSNEASFLNHTDENNVEGYDIEKNSFSKITSLTNNTSFTIDSPIKIDENSNISEQNQIDNTKNDNQKKEKSSSKAEIHQKSNSREKAAAYVPKEVSTKPRYGATIPNKSAYQNKLVKGPKRKFVPSSSLLTNASAKVVLFEKKVEIKDLESQVKYLQNQIKELKIENKTLLDVKSRQERELRKFKEGVADIPSLLKSHREETKVLESTLASVRKDLRESQKELKLRQEIISRKNHQIEKQNSILKRNEKLLQDNSHELKVLNNIKQELEDENRRLLESNKNLNSQNEDYQKKIQEMAGIVIKLEENLSDKNDLNKQLDDDLHKLKLQYDELQHKHFEILEKQLEDSLTFVDTSENTRISPVPCLVPEEKLDPTSVLQDTENEVPEERRFEKIKSAHISTLKYYQDICSTEFNDNSLKLGQISSRNVKPLPPLKQSCKKYSQNKDSSLGGKDLSSSSTFCIKPKFYEDKLSDEESHNYSLEMNLKNNISTSKRPSKYNIPLSRPLNPTRSVSHLRIPWLHE